MRGYEEVSTVVIVPDWFWYTQQVLRGITVLLSVACLIFRKQVLAAWRDWFAQE